MANRRTRCWLLSCCLILVSLSGKSSPIAASPAAASDTTVTFDLIIDNDYDDSTVSLANLDALLRWGLTEFVPRGQPLERYMFKRYKFGPSQLPKTFALIRKYVKQINAERRPQDRWRIPAIPRRRYTKRNKRNPFHDLPRVAMFAVTGKYEYGFDVKQKKTTEQGFRRGSKYTLYRVTMTRAEFSALGDVLKSGPLYLGVTSDFATATVPSAAHRPLGPLQLLTSANVGTSEESASTASGASAPREPREHMEPMLTSANVGTGEESTSTASGASASREPREVREPREAREPREPREPRDTAAISRSLIAPSSAPGPGIVVQGWPVPTISVSPMLTVAGAGALAKNSNPLSPYETFAMMADKYMPPAVPKSTYMIVLDDGWPNQASADDSVAFFSAEINTWREIHHLPRIALKSPVLGPTDVGSHAGLIAESIRALHAADKGSVVKIIYVPVVLNANTEKLCWELIRTSWLIESETMGVFHDVSDLEHMDESAMNGATLQIDGWKKQLALGQDPGRFRVAGAQLNAIYRLTEERVRRERTVFVANLSWTIRGDKVALSPPRDSISVAATGDHGEKVLTDRVDFAQQAADSDAFVAVMFVNANYEDEWNTGTLGEETDDFSVKPYRVVAYDGDLTLSGEIGSSFAAPRVAWMLAAIANPGTSAPAIDWRSTVQNKLRQARLGGKTPWKNIYLNPLQLWPTPTH